MARNKRQTAIIELRKAISSYQDVVTSIGTIAETIGIELNVGDAVHALGEMDAETPKLTGEDLDWFVRDCKEDDD